MSRIETSFTILWLTISTICNGSNAALTRTPVDTTLLPRQLLRLNCSSDVTNVPVAWYATRLMSAKVALFINNATPSQFSSLYRVDRSSPYDLLATTNMTTSYCGKYECVDQNDLGTSATAFVAVADGPYCTVNTSEVEMNDKVLFQCWVNSTCGDVNVMMTLRHNNVITSTGNNIVMWTTMTTDSQLIVKCVAESRHGVKFIVTSCPQVSLVFAPTYVVLTPSRSTYQPGERIQCKADASPPPSYYWTELVSGNVVQGDILVIDDSMLNQSFTFQCTATNYFKGQTYRSVLQISFSVVNKTEELNGVQRDDNNNISDGFRSATIGLAVIAIISLIIIIVLFVILFLVYRNSPKAFRLSHNGSKPEAVGRVQHAISTETGNSDDYSTLNMTSANSPVVYDSLNNDPGS